MLSSEISDRGKNIKIDTGSSETGNSEMIHSEERTGWCKNDREDCNEKQRNI